MMASVYTQESCADANANCVRGKALSKQRYNMLMPFGQLGC